MSDITNTHTDTTSSNSTTKSDSPLCPDVSVSVQPLPDISGGVKVLPAGWCGTVGSGKPIGICGTCGMPPVSPIPWYGVAVTTSASASESTQTESTQPESTQPESTQPESARPETESAQPGTESTQSGSTQTESAQTESAQIEPESESNQTEVKQKYVKHGGKYNNNKKREQRMLNNMKNISKKLQKNNDSKGEESTNDILHKDMDNFYEDGTYNNANRPFVHALKVYKEEYLLPEIEKAKNELSKNTDSGRYARIKLNLFSDFVEVDVINNAKGEVQKKTYVYPLHVLHYGPIIKNRESFKIESEDPEFIKATHFCWRDNKIWLKVNAEGKKPGGDGFGYDNTACSPFRDIQVELRDEGYYLQDLSKHYLDKKTNKYQYKIDIRLYMSVNHVKPMGNLWHKYGTIPGLGAIKTQETTYVVRKVKNRFGKDADSGESLDKSDVNKPKFSQYIDVAVDKK